MMVASDSSPECLSKVMGSDSSSECFSKVMASMPGFRFHPTDEELIMYYLKRKMCRKKLKLDVIRETDVYKWDPEELPGICFALGLIFAGNFWLDMIDETLSGGQSVLKTGDRQWFFFTHRDRKYPNSARSNRGTRHGYWKATGKDRNVIYNSRTVGVKKTLVFYRGRAPNGERTDWVMHEYTLEEEELKRCQGFKDYYALYKVFKKSGPGPKNGEQYGAPFKEEEWVDDDLIDFNINSAEKEAPISQLDNGTSVDTVTFNNQVQPLFDDDIDEILKKMMDEHVPDQPFYPALPQVAAEETQSIVVDQFSRESIFDEPIKMFHSSGLQSDVQHSHDLTQSATSHLHVSEAPEVTSAPIIQAEEPHLHEDDFLEIDDLIGPEPTVSNIENPSENLQFEDGLSVLDLYYDAEMFLRDMGPVDQEAISHPYMNTFDSNIVNQHYQSQLIGEDANQTGGEFWMHEQRHILSPAEHTNGSFPLPTSGVVCESASLPAEGNHNQSSSPMGDVATSRFSSALWAFVESIPTTPASAAENANRAFERMSSFGRVRINIKQANLAAAAAAAAAAGNDTATMKRSGRRKGVLFLFLPVLVALCAFLWVSLGTLRLFGRSIS
ncbi:NAC domain-containing protein 17-like [Senna tora]|uniref:NAC domain-containing protein 17-like n=1 Tax=Senna tora TaxID=362788 RepID=A0A834WF53_9FABA|nr:NAC domain-containing protein 17-like [Senna tora]